MLWKTEIQATVYIPPIVWCAAVCRIYQESHVPSKSSILIDPREQQLRSKFVYVLCGDCSNQCCSLAVDPKVVSSRNGSMINTRLKFASTEINYSPINCDALRFVDGDGIRENQRKLGL